MIWIFNYFSLSYIHPLMDPVNPQYCVHSKRGVKGGGEGKKSDTREEGKGKKKEKEKGKEKEKDKGSVN